MNLSYGQERVLLALTDEYVPALPLLNEHECDFEELFRIINQGYVKFKEAKDSGLLIAISEAGKIRRTEFATADQIANAELLVSSIMNALRRGVKHFNKAGQELPDAKSILICLLNEGSVTLREPKP